MIRFQTKRAQLLAIGVRSEAKTMRNRQPCTAQGRQIGCLGAEAVHVGRLRIGNRDDE
jgi:hypothetical protein